MFDIEFCPKQQKSDLVNDAGFIYAANYSKDDDTSVFFACGAGKNELKVFENNTEEGLFRNLGVISDTQAFLCMDTGNNGTQLCFGKQKGKIGILNFEIDYDREIDDDLKTSSTGTRTAGTKTRVK